MIARSGCENAPMNNTSMELKSDRKIVIARTFNGRGAIFRLWFRRAHAARGRPILFGYSESPICRAAAEDA